MLLNMNIFIFNFGSVYLFIQRFKKFEFTKKKAQMVCNKLRICLQNKSLKWWHDKLGDDKREMTKFVKDKNIFINQ